MEEDEGVLWPLEELKVDEVDTPMELEERVSMWLEPAAEEVEDASLLEVWPLGERET